MTFLSIFIFIVFQGNAATAEVLCGPGLGKCPQSSTQHQAISIEQKSMLAQKASDQVKSHSSSISKQKQFVQSASHIDTGNLSSRSRDGQVIDGNGEIYVSIPKKIGAKLDSLQVGDVLFATVSGKIKASPSVPTPVRAVIDDGPLKGSVLVGSATLDRELKRVLIDFKHLSNRSSGQVFNFLGKAKDAYGRIGIEGSYHSDEAMFFTAEFASALAAGYAASNVTQTPTAFGQYQTLPTPGNNSASAAATAAGKTTEHFADKVRNAAEFTEIEGQTRIQVIVEDDVREANEY